MPRKHRKPLPLPSTTVDHGRQPDGRFGPNNAFARGGAPLASRGLELRSAFLAAVSRADIATIVAKLIERAKRGDVRAAREILNRACGKPIAQSTVEPLQLIVLAESIVAERIDAIRSLRLRHAAGEMLDLSPSEDARTARLEAAQVDPPAERRRVLRELAEGGQS